MNFLQTLNYDLVNYKYNKKKKQIHIKLKYLNLEIRGSLK